MVKLTYGGNLSAETYAEDSGHLADVSEAGDDVETRWDLKKLERLCVKVNGTL